MGPARHELIPLSDRARWQAALAEVRHGHAHTWGWCHAMQLSSGLATFLYRYECGGSRVLCAIAEREFRGELDVLTPYGFGGFVTRGPCERFRADWERFARSRGWVCGYLALNPVLCDAEAFSGPEARIRQRLYVLDLRGSPDELFGRLSQNRRRQLRGWPTTPAPLVRDRARLADFFVETYADFFARREAGRAYDFAAQTMRAVAELDDVIVVGAGQRAVEAAAVFGVTAACADYLFNVSRLGGERHAPFLIWAAVEELRQRGVSRLNLGGGIRDGDQVAEFKRRFGAIPLAVVELCQVYRPGVYAKLCAEAGASAAVGSGYFPAYHA